MKLNVIDLFAGCGGLTEGFLQTGFYRTLATVDWEQPTVQTIKNRLITKWEYNPDNRNILYFDLQRVEELIKGYSDEKYGSSIGLDKIIGKQRVDLIIGGPPCQAYSMAGRVQDRNGMKDDYRNYLFESYVKLVSHYQPKAFVFENVEGILSAKPGGFPIIERITKAFDNIGYQISSDLRKYALFDTSYLNVPQKRKRVIIFGVPKNQSSKIDDFYRNLRSLETDIALPSKTAFDNLPKFFPKKVSSRVSYEIDKNSIQKIKNHIPRFHNDRDIGIFRLLAEDIKSGKEQYTSTKALIQLYKEKTGKNSSFHKYHVIRKDKPSNTIPAHLYKDGLRHIHPDPDQARTITVREAARLQTFPDDFEFFGSRGDQYKMIGNAVPPEFARVIAKVIHNLLNK